MTRTLTCIICPRGEQYAAKECTHPVRTVTAPVAIGDVIIKDVYGTAIVATSAVL